MRDILVTLLVFGSLPFILKRPYIGVLVWSWISYMNPHRLTWGFAYSLPFAQIVAVTLLFSFLISREKKSYPVRWVGRSMAALRGVDFDHHTVCDQS